MKKKDFEELLQSAREAVEIRKGRRAAARRTTVPVIDTREVRARLRLSQTKFAALIGVSVYTVRNWEQRRRAPEGPARVLLQVVATNVNAVRAAIAGHLKRPLFDWRSSSRTPGEEKTVNFYLPQRTFVDRGFEYVLDVPPLQGGSCELADLAA